MGTLLPRASVAVIPAFRELHCDSQEPAESSIFGRNTRSVARSTQNYRVRVVARPSDATFNSGGIDTTRVSASSASVVLAHAVLHSPPRLRHGA